ncbi:MAG TPA: ABC transporter permease [Verrucomicrobiae bacterium]|nr:ABC transporter permease [Verrucomicrobiae bacterium]
MLIRDLIHASRGLRKNPAFALTAIFTIALGIGASTAIFSVVNAVLLRPLPYKDAGRLALIESDMRARGVKNFPLSPPNFADIRAQANLFEDVSALSTIRIPVPGENSESEQAPTAFCAPNLLHLMGARVILGRDLTESDAAPVPPPQPGQPPAPPPPAMSVIRYEYWQRRFGGDPAIIGRSFDFGGGGGKAQIVGVLEPGFKLLFPPKSGLEKEPDIITPARINYATANRNNVFLFLIGRLKPGVTRDRVQSQLDGIAGGLRDRFAVYRGANFALRVEPMQDDLVAGIRPAIRMLMGAVIFLLLIACANVANLLLVRSSARSRELAVRAAIGGGRWDLVRQMLSESLLIAAAGGILGVVLAYFGIQFLLSLAPDKLPRLGDISIDVTTLLFTTAATIAATAIFGIVPALRASRPDLIDALRASGRASGLGGGKLLRNSVVVAEVALSFVLLVGCGLMIRSFLVLTHTDLAFYPARLLAFTMPPSTIPPGPDALKQTEAFQYAFRDRLRALAGVEAVTSITQAPLDQNTFKGRWGLAEALADNSKYHAADFQAITAGYFETLGTTVLAGRTFTDADSQPGRKLVIVDRLLAAKAFPGRSAVGQRILARVNTPEPEWFEIIGVVEHQRAESLADEGLEQMFFTEGYFGFGTANTWILKTSVDPVQLGPLVRAEIRKFDPRLAVDGMHPMTFFVDRAEAETRFVLVLIGIFAGISVLLAAVGLYGVLASAVRLRTAEIGLRMALGAAPSKIFGSVIGQGLGLSALGVVLGVIGAFFLTRAIASVLIGVPPNDPLTFAGMALLFFLVAAMASWLPARRAAILDPTTALREE